MPVKIGNSYVSEVAYNYAKFKVDAAKETETQEKKSTGGMSVLSDLKEQYKNLNFSTNTAPFSAKGTNNLAISPKILKQMEEDPEKRMEYEALIYDCNEVLNRPTRDGIKAQGMIINDDGSLGMWGIGVSTDNGGNNKTHTLLDKNKPLLEQLKKKKKKSKTAVQIYQEQREKNAGKIKIAAKNKNKADEMKSAKSVSPYKKEKTPGGTIDAKG